MRAVRSFIIGVLLVAVAVGVYLHRRGSASDRIKAEMFLIANDMRLSAAERAEVKALIGHFHEAPFRRALDLSKEHGRKFDGKRYYQEVFGLVTSRLRDDGDSDLADKVERQQAHFSLRITER